MAIKLQEIVSHISRSGEFGRNEDEFREESEIMAMFQEEIDQAILDDIED